MRDKNAYALLTILHDHAPNGIAQEKCSDIYRTAGLEQPDKLELIMAGTLYDGLAHGNWPWTVMP